MAFAAVFLCPRLKSRGGFEAARMRGYGVNRFERGSKELRWRAFGFTTSRR